MWDVTCDFVENKVTGERKGMFDCEPWAREFANELNRRETNENH